MLVFESHRDSRRVYVDVDGSMAKGYRIIRQVLMDDEELEAIWELDPEHALALREALAGVVADEGLVPAEGHHEEFGALLQQELLAITPQFTWHSRD